MKKCEKIAYIKRKDCFGKVELGEIKAKKVKIYRPSDWDKKAFGLVLLGRI